MKRGASGLELEVGDDELDQSQVHPSTKVRISQGVRQPGSFVRGGCE